MGDEQVKGLSSALLNSRKEKWNDVYMPFSFIKPDATSTEILKYCDQLKTEVSENDYVIICVGNHDTNPNLLFSNLCIALDKLRHTNVYLLPTIYNEFLNGRKIINLFKLVATMFRSSTYLDINFKESTSYIKYLCVKINSRIDFAQYKYQYLTFENIKKRIMVMESSKKPENNKSPRKGTIPFYFKPVNLYLKPSETKLSSQETALPKRNSTTIRTSCITQPQCSGGKNIEVDKTEFFRV